MTEWDNLQWAEPSLASLLTTEQQEKLPLIYLNIEGLAALRRTEFQALIGLTLKEQEKIADVYNEVASYGGRANVGHRGLFTLRNDQLFHAAKSFNLLLLTLDVALVLGADQILRQGVGAKRTGTIIA